MSRALTLARRFGPALLLVIAVAWVLSSGLLSHLSLEEVGRRQAQLSAYVQAYPIRSFVIFVGLDIAIAALSLPGSGVMTLTAGFLFGPWIGGLAATLGVGIGSTILFLIGRGAFGDVLARRAGPKVAKFEAGIRDNAFPYLLSLRLLPFAPIQLVTLAAALLEAPLRAFVLATFLGIAPLALVVAGLGAGFGGAFARGEHPGLHMAAEPRILGPMVALMILSLASAIYAARQRRKSA